MFLPVFGDGRKIVGTDVDFRFELFSKGLGCLGVSLKIPFQPKHQSLKIVNCGLKAVDPFR